MMGCALLADGTVRCWGEGPLGDGTLHGPGTPPVQVEDRKRSLTGVTMLASGWTGTCAGTSSGIHCWGSNNSYGLGVDAVTGATTIPPVLNAKPVPGRVDRSPWR